MANELARKLINAGVHFGHSSSRWNPKMAPYIFSKRGKIHIIDVRQTFKGMLIAKKLLVDIVSSGKDVVFVGTKRQAQKAVEKAADKCGMHHISERWLGGMLTNFRTIRSRLQRLEELEAMQESGTLDSESKKQASRLKREMNKIKTNLDGVRKMSKLPGVVVVVDVRKEHIALAEAKKLGIATIGLIDTNSDPDSVDVAIPANDDSIRAVDIILDQLADAVSVGKTMSITKERTDEKPKRAKSSRTVTARADETEQAAAVTAAPVQEPKVEAPAEEPKVETPSPAAPVEEPQQETAQEEIPKEESNQ
ncbi:MAG: 30S ribosomal protein S2 [Planctomycetes bacterium]|nr:30S ribosomal protein S2 [Planctomycetota bacterium]